MNYHIVRTNERVTDIADAYSLSAEEIKSINHHIRSWEKLIPGTKLKLPAISEQIRIELDDNEPFIEDYYPKIAVDELKATGINPSISSTTEELPIEKETQEAKEVPAAKPKTPAVKSATPYPRPLYPYYPYYNPYYPYYVYPNYQYGQRKR